MSPEPLHPPGPNPRRPEPTLPDPGKTEDPGPTPKETAVAVDVLVGLALIVIAVWCTWHHGLSTEGIEQKVILTWLWVGLMPAFALSMWAFIP